MNREKFLTLLEHPHDVSAPDLAALEQLVHNFPYCQLAYALIAGAHRKQASMLTSQKLKRAAVYAVHRDVLKRMLTAGEAASGTPNPVSPSENLLAEPVQSPEADSASVPSVENYGSQSQPAVLEVSEEITTPVGRFDKVKQQQIIENFIKTEPRISALKQAEKDAFTNRDLSVTSIQQPTGLVSENLANILVKQGKIDKAIGMYEQLMLKYPEKKTYFASRIEELKNL